MTPAAVARVALAGALGVAVDAVAVGTADVRGALVPTTMRERLRAE